MDCAVFLLNVVIYLMIDFPLLVISIEMVECYITLAGFFYIYHLKEFVLKFLKDISNEVSWKD